MKMEPEHRDAYDLYNKQCRINFYKRVVTDWKDLSFWALVYRDTRDRVCSRIAE